MNSLEKKQHRQNKKVDGGKIVSEEFVAPTSTIGDCT
jgi:hypothetical protein